MTLRPERGNWCKCKDFEPGKHTNRWMGSVGTLVMRVPGKVISKCVVVFMWLCTKLSTSVESLILHSACSNIVARVDACSDNNE